MEKRRKNDSNKFKIKKPLKYSSYQKYPCLEQNIDLDVSAQFQTGIESNLIHRKTCESKYKKRQNQGIRYLFPQIKLKTKKNQFQQSFRRAKKQKRPSSLNYTSSYQKVQKILAQMQGKLEKLQINSKAKKMFKENYPQLAYIDQTDYFHSRVRYISPENYSHHKFSSLGVLQYSSFSQHHQDWNVPQTNNISYHNFPSSSYTQSVYQTQNSLGSFHKILKQTYRNLIPKNTIKSKNIKVSTQLYRPLQGPCNQNKNKSPIKKKITCEQKKRLMRKLRKCVWALIFVKRLPKYSSAILAQKYLIFKSENHNQLIKQTEKKLIGLFSKINYLKPFKQCTKQLENQRVQEPTKISGIKIVQEGIQFFVDFQLSNKYLDLILDQIYKFIENDEIEFSYSILIHFLKGQFPCHNLFLLEQLEILNFKKNTGKLQISQEMSQQLLGNYLIIRLLVYKLFLKNNHTSIFLKRLLQKKQNQKKKIILYGKKIKMSLLILYKIVNEMFDSLEKANHSNYYKIHPKKKAEPAEPLSYSFKFTSQKNEGKKKGLIRNITGLQYLQSQIMEYFQPSKDKIKKVIALLYKKLIAYQSQRLKNIKNKVLASQQLKIHKLSIKMPAYQPLQQEGQNKQDKQK